LKEKFVGAANEKPLDFRFTFAFPSTPEGQAEFEALKNCFTTGAPVSINSDFIQSVEVPDTLNSLLGSSFF
jgi:hypothetical protein